MTAYTGISSDVYGKEGTSTYKINPSTTAPQVAMHDADGGDSTVESEIVKLRTKVAGILSDGVAFKGAVTSTTPLPTVSYKAGWQYIVQEAGTYAGQTCEVGDYIICVKDYASGSASATKDWAVIQKNIVGAVTGPASAVSGRIAVFDGTSGTIIKDSGLTIGVSVPADAKFTDTQYAPATNSADGLLSAALHEKLVGVESGADVTDAANVAAAGAFMKASDTADSIAEGTTKKLMTAAERTKLSGITAGAQPNQNAFSVVRVGDSTASAATATDTLTLAPSDNVSITLSGKTITIDQRYRDTCIVTDVSNVPANLRDGGIVIVKVN